MKSILKGTDLRREQRRKHDAYSVRVLKGRRYTTWGLFYMAIHV